MSGVGNLKYLCLRPTNRGFSFEQDDYFEIVSITRTLSIYGSHLHIPAADGNGHTWGGHLESGCKIYTTAEIGSASFDDIVYKREFAEDCGYEELVVYEL